MDNKEKLIRNLLAGAQLGHVDARSAALVAIGESGLIDEDRLVQALEKNSSGGHVTVVSAALTGMGLMLKNSNRQ
ncbi:hypothetical protein HQ397_04115 [Aeromonas hydrophila]|uniref:hypothetical protein n=1 Tax=Aeromonas hydrophila TaxID=644 RepID=UPI001C78F200|nr:hypothetical protein [Aeromonas hydrophila]QWL69393.1 hypothetical protein HQ397_04115 [Aeromonas hydrophila]